MDRVLPSDKNDQYFDKQTAYGHILYCQQNVMCVHLQALYGFSRFRRSTLPFPFYHM